MEVDLRPGQIPDLTSFFHEINLRHFDNFLECPDLFWNSRLRSSAGRFHPGYVRRGIAFPARIEVASYLKSEVNAIALISDTVAHEMIHYWLWVRRRPYGHTREFLAKMRVMGVNRYNPVPRPRKYKYVYGCPVCEKRFPARKKLGSLACLTCCKAYSGGKFDSRFKLLFLGEFSNE